MRRLADGVTAYVTGTYREIRPSERLAFTWRWEDEPEHGETLVTVELRDVGGATEMVLMHERFPSVASRDSHARGWPSCFDKLATALKP
jgi:uncharacterized protein YndB with AHSA1/START domain